MLDALSLFGVYAGIAVMHSHKATPKPTQRTVKSIQKQHLAASAPGHQERGAGSPDPLESR